MSDKRQYLYGISAEFSDPHDLLDAAKKAKDAGYEKIEAFTPYEVHGLSELLGEDSKLLEWLVLLGGVGGGVGAFAVQYWSSAVHYTLNLGGRPLVPWPNFLPITFEATILGGALAAALYMFWRNGFPTPYHPIFNADTTSPASVNGFVMVIETADDKFDLQGTRDFLEGLNPVSISEVAG
ncbi:MAG: DUF3341 domain-containing protein [Chloroflexota bacterium]